MMKQLNTIQNLIFQAGGILLLLGIMMWIPRLSFAPYVFGVGALCFSSMQFVAGYEGRNMVIKRLRMQQVLGSIFLLVTAALLIGSQFHLPYPTRNEWIVTLTVAAIFELYPSFRIPVELKKEQR